MELDFSEIKFKEGLIPAVIQDTHDKAILMVAYMNRASLTLSLQTGETHFFSRSRQKLWKKGETSGHIQKIKHIFVDCDQDTLLVEVEQIKVACHTGERSCFYREIMPDGQLTHRTDTAIMDRSGTQNAILETLSETISKRKASPDKKSYTSLLFQKGLDHILKKVGEESGEVIISAKNGNPEEIIHETADLLYHLLVTLGYYNIPFSAVEAELKRRTAQSGLAEKASRKKTEA